MDVYSLVRTMRPGIGFRRFAGRSQSTGGAKRALTTETKPFRRGEAALAGVAALDGFVY
jgi:hypothetical protein